MNSRPSAILLLLFFMSFVVLCLSSSEESYKSCSKLFNCGNITDVDYPFWGGDQRPYGCGYPELELSCNNDIASIEIMNVKYQVLDINSNNQMLRIAREDYLGEICRPQFVNTTLDFNLFDYAPGYMNLTFLYGCPHVFSMGLNISWCEINGFSYEDVFVMLGVQGPGICDSSVVVPVPQMAWTGTIKLVDLYEILTQGFEVLWKVDKNPCIECTKSLGKCGYNFMFNETTCLCPNRIYGSPTCSSPSADVAPWVSPPTLGSSSKSSNISLPIGIAIGGAGIVGILVGFLVFYYRQRRKKIADLSKRTDLPPTPSSKSLIPTPTTNFSQSNPSYASSRSTDLEKGSTYFGVQVFSYTELEQATENFDPSKELGEGGFGTVYYGKLHDGRVVAVKRLYENNFKRVEQFMNEVEILTRLRHKNLVVLYGCTSRRSRELLLVYEYIPNGTVADHLHGKKANSGLLTWPVRLSIAIETADALAYLHASDIIHRDVKTNNILLDNDFRVKVADFGLSRLFPNDVTHVSTAPQGTPGYVDPEYYQCYQLTDKSDVYSFGVVLIELISSKEAVDTNRHRHDINLANMAVNKIQNHTLHELVDPCLGFETDLAVMRMTTAVAELAFRCLQQEKDMRPTMEEVLRILRGIENEEFNVEKPEVVDIRADDIGLLKSLPPPSYSPDSIATDKWVPNSF